MSLIERPFGSQCSGVKILGPCSLRFKVQGLGFRVYGRRHALEQWYEYLGVWFGRRWLATWISGQGAGLTRVRSQESQATRGPFM